MAEGSSPDPGELSDYVKMTANAAGPGLSIAIPLHLKEMEGD
jgi:hypothetical protein